MFSVLTEVTWFYLLFYWVFLWPTFCNFAFAHWEFLLLLNISKIKQIEVSYRIQAGGWIGRVLLHYFYDRKINIPLQGIFYQYTLLRYVHPVIYIAVITQSWNSLLMLLLYFMQEGRYVARCNLRVLMFNLACCDLWY